MSEHKLEVAAGAAVLAVGLGFAIFAGRDLGPGPAAGSYPLLASFRSVEGVAVGADVKLAGVKVGTITALTLNTQTFMADATIAMNGDILLPVDSAIIISQAGLLGDNYVEILPGGMPDVLGPGDEIEDTQGTVSLVTLLMKFVGGAGDGGAGDGPAPGDAAP